MKTSHRALLRPILLTAGAAIGLAGFLPAAPAQAAAATYRIAVMGDSWASGEGSDPYAANTSSLTGCHRSLDAWAYRVVLPDGHTVRTDYNNGTASMQFLACQGATTSDLYGTYNGEGSQIDRLFSTTTHVFLSISGNDLRFGDILEKCVTTTLKTCTDFIAATKADRLPTAIGNLMTAIRKIHAKVPTAEIILTGYAAPVGDRAIPWTFTWSALKDLRPSTTAGRRLPWRTSPRS